MGLYAFSEFFINVCLTNFVSFQRDRYRIQGLIYLLSDNGSDPCFCVRSAYGYIYCALFQRKHSTTPQYSLQHFHQVLSH